MTTKLGLIRALRPELTKARDAAETLFCAIDKAVQFLDVMYDAELKAEALSKRSLSNRKVISLTKGDKALLNKIKLRDE